MRRFAYSMIDMIITLLILGTMLAVAAPQFAKSIARRRSELAARRLAADLAYGATMARVNSREVEINFEKGPDPDESYYWFDWVTNPDRPSQLYQVILRDPPYLVVLSDAPGDIKFDVYGAPKDSRTFVLQQGTPYQRIVTIDKNTGVIAIQ